MNFIFIYDLLKMKLYEMNVKNLLFNDVIKE